MIDAGILVEDDRVELLEGLIIDKMTHNPPHDCTIHLVQTEHLRRLPEEWLLRIQSAITLADSEPEPDLAVTRGPIRRYMQAHPGPKDLALVVEVAETTLAEDRVDKGRIYARAGIPLYWIMNLVESQVEVYTHPRRGKTPAYRERRDFGRNAAVPLVIAGRDLGSIRVRDILP
jgi:Uma2 family endonuclease